MRFAHLSSLLLLAVAPMVASQAQAPDLFSFVDRIPQCGLSCILEQVPLSACGSLTNSTCICTDVDLRKATEKCVTERCTNALEGIEVARVEAEACQRPDRSRKPDLLVPLIIEIPAWFSVWLRLYSRYSTVHRFEADDWIMLVCVIMNTPFLILGHYIGISCFGVDIWTVDADDLTQCLKLFYIDESFYVICLSLAKLSILCFFLRIFPNRVFRIITYSVMIFIGMSTTVFVFLQIFQCSPIEYNWLGWKGTFGSFRCLNVNTLVYTAAGFSIAQDVIILVLPLPLLFGLNMSWRSKMGIVVMFSLGIFILITSCIRLQYIVHFARSTNPTWDYTDTLIWTGLEVSVSMLVTSLPAIRMLVNRVVPDVLGTITSKYGFSFGSKKQVSGDSTDLRSGKYSDATYSNSVSGPSSRPAVPESRFKLFRVGGKGQMNESELELGDKLKGDVQTEIGASPSSWMDVVADQDRHSSMESGIHVHTTTTVDSESGYVPHGRRPSQM